MLLTNQIRGKLNHFRSGDGAVAIEELADFLWEYHSNQLILTEGDQLYREQGAAQLAKFLKELPKVLRDDN